MPGSATVSTTRTPSGVGLKCRRQWLLDCLSAAQVRGAAVAGLASVDAFGAGLAAGFALAGAAAVAGLAATAGFALAAPDLAASGLAISIRTAGRFGAGLVAGPAAARLAAAARFASLAPPGASGSLPALPSAD